MVHKSEQISNLATALLKAQADIGSALKSATNPYFKSSYANLKDVIEAVKEPLNKNGVTFLQAVDMDSNGDASLPVVDTILLHESGQFLSTRTPVFCAKPNDPQAFGSGITYSKRYALQALMGLPTQDDDGEAAMNRNGKAKAEAAKKAKAKIKNEKKDSQEIPLIEQAYFEFTTVHQNALLEGFQFSTSKFRQSVKSTFGGLPTSKDSIKRICAEMTPDLAMIEIPR